MHSIYVSLNLSVLGFHLSCHHVMARHQVADGGNSLQIRRIAANCRKGVVLQLVIWERANNSWRWNV